jgi:hypothetical protein
MWKKGKRLGKYRLNWGIFPLNQKVGETLLPRGSRGRDDAQTEIGEHGVSFHYKGVCNAKSYLYQGRTGA